MLALMSVWFPTLGHPIPKGGAISCAQAEKIEVPTFSWVASTVGRLQRRLDKLTLAALLAQGRA